MAFLREARRNQEDLGTPATRVGTDLERYNGKSPPSHLKLPSGGGLPRIGPLGYRSGSGKKKKKGEGKKSPNENEARLQRSVGGFVHTVRVSSSTRLAKGSFFLERVSHRVTR